ncbi:MAG: hypothetical protein UMV23_00830 [Halanaerobium sp.]|nr:hypothetical protein [Halanaerobium sp.]
MDRRINIFCGNYGSGKTEIAINYSLAMKERYPRVAIVDLDIVNPYFRSREAGEILESAGVDVIQPEGALAHADLPAISPEILGKLSRPDYQMVFDVGGDDTGAVALGSYFSKISREPYDLFFVINPYRPFTGQTEGVEEILVDVQRASRLEVTKLVSNPNLGRDTTAAEVQSGHRRVLKMADELELPVAYLTVLRELVPEIEDDIKEEIFPIARYMKTPWERR